MELSRRIVESALSDDASKGASVDRFLGELEAMGGSAGGSNGTSSATSGNGAQA